MERLNKRYQLAIRNLFTTAICRTISTGSSYLAGYDIASMLASYYESKKSGYLVQIQFDSKHKSPVFSLSEDEWHKDAGWKYAYEWLIANAYIVVKPRYRLVKTSLNKLAPDDLIEIDGQYVKFMSYTKGSPIQLKNKVVKFFIIQFENSDMKSEYKSIMTDTCNAAIKVGETVKRTEKNFVELFQK